MVVKIPWWWLLVVQWWEGMWLMGDPLSYQPCSILPEISYQCFFLMTLSSWIWHLIMMNYMVNFCWGATGWGGIHCFAEVGCWGGALLNEVAVASITAFWTRPNLLGNPTKKPSCCDGGVRFVCGQNHGFDSLLKQWLVSWWYIHRNWGGGKLARSKAMSPTSDCFDYHHVEARESTMAQAPRHAKFGAEVGGEGGRLIDGHGTGQVATFCHVASRCHWVAPLGLETTLVVPSWSGWMFHDVSTKLGSDLLLQTFTNSMVERWFTSCILRPRWGFLQIRMLSHWKSLRLCFRPPPGSLGLTNNQPVG